MANDKTKIIGLDDLEVALKSIAPMLVGKGYPKNPLRNASRAMAKVVQESAKQKAPVKTGRLKNAITIKLLDLKYRDHAALGGNSKEYFYIGHKAGKSRDDLAGAYYGNIVEGGHIAKNGTVVPAQPHLRPALEENKGRLESVFINKISSDIERVRRKIERDNRSRVLMKGRL